MAGENEGAQTNTGAPEGTQSVDTSQAGNTTLLSSDGKQAETGKPETEGETTGTESKGAEDAGKTDGKEGDGKPEGDAAADKPVEYAAFDMPEGVTVDEEALGKFKPIAQELGLDQSKAQKLVTMYAEMQTEQAKAFADQVSQWGDDARNDKEIGGAKFDESLKTAITGLNAFGSPELTDLLNTTGLGNHPEVIRFCHRVGTALQEDKTLAPGAAAGKQLSAGQVLFDNPTSQPKR